MTVQVGPLETSQIPCMHASCITRYRRSARWVIPHARGSWYACSVHLPRFVEIEAEAAIAARVAAPNTFVTIAPLVAETKVRCSFERCDGRGAKWVLPQGSSHTGERLCSCSIHLPKLAPIAYRAIRKAHRQHGYGQAA